MRNLKITGLVGFLILSLNVSIVSCASIPQIYQQSYDEEAKGNYTEAIFVLMRAGRAGDNSYIYHLRMGWLQYLARKYSNAVNSYRMAVKLNKDSIEAKLGLMLPLMAQRKWAEAVEVGKEIIAVDNVSYLANSRLAYIYYNLGRYREAERFYKKILMYYPSDVQMQAGLAWSLLKQEKKKDAEKFFKNILRTTPNHVSATAGMNIIKGDR